MYINISCLTEEIYLYVISAQLVVQSRSEGGQNPTISSDNIGILFHLK